MSSQGIGDPIAIERSVDRAKGWGNSVTIAIAIVITIGVIVRASCLLISTQDPSSRKLEDDSHGYLTLAGNLVDGKGFGRYVTIQPDGPMIWTPELLRIPVKGKFFESTL